MYSLPDRLKSFSYQWRAFWLALAVAGLLEVAVGLFGAQMGVNTLRSNFTQLAYLQQDNYAKYLIETKLQLMSRVQPDIIQVGDSSGSNVGIPEIIESYVPGYTFFLINCCADMGYVGHGNIAEAAILRLGKQLKYIILYVTPYAPASNFGNVGTQLADDVRREFIVPTRHLYPLAMGLRTLVTNLVYYGTANTDITANPLNDRMPSLQKLEEQALVMHGYSGEIKQRHAQTQVPRGSCQLDPPASQGGGRVNGHFEDLSTVAAMARRHGVKLIVAFNPIGCTRENSPSALRIEREIAQFRAIYPEVIFPFELVTTWSPDIFFDSYHLHEPEGKIAARRLGEAVRKAVTDPGYRGVPPKTIEQIDTELVRAQSTLPH